MCSIVAANWPLSRRSSAKPFANPRETRQISVWPSSAMRHPLSHRMWGRRSRPREHAMPTELRSSRKERIMPGMAGASANRDMTPRYGTIPQLHSFRGDFPLGARLARVLRLQGAGHERNFDDDENDGGVGPGGGGG